MIAAAAFIKCLYALGGELASILVQMMNSANINDFLDNNVESTKDKSKVKKVLHNGVDKDRLFTPEDSDIVREREEIFRFIWFVWFSIAATHWHSLISSMDLIENPVTTCGKILEYIDEMWLYSFEHVCLKTIQVGIIEMIEKEK